MNIRARTNPLVVGLFFGANKSQNLEVCFFITGILCFIIRNGIALARFLIYRSQIYRTHAAVFFIIAIGHASKAIRRITGPNYHTATTNYTIPSKNRLPGSVARQCLVIERLLLLNLSKISVCC
jgi:hypothetical protein